MFNVYFLTSKCSRSLLNFLPTGRQIEARKLNDTVPPRSIPNKVPLPRMSPPHLTSKVPLPRMSPKLLSQVKEPSFTAKEPSFTANRAQEPPRVDFFEDRLKFIISNVLKEDKDSRTLKQESKPPPILHQNHVPDYTQVSS